MFQNIVSLIGHLLEEPEFTQEPGKPHLRAAFTLTIFHWS